MQLSPIACIQVVISSVAIIVTIVFSILGISSVPIIVISLFSIILLRLNEISRLVLKALGFEATIEKAEQVTAEAQAAIDALKVLSRNLSHAVLELQGIQGRENAVITLISRVHFRGALENNLLGLGFTSEDIAPIFQRFDSLLTNDLFGRALHFIPKSIAKGALQRELDSYPEMPDLETLKDVYRKHNLLYPDVEMLLSEGDRYRREKRIVSTNIK